MIRGLCGAAQLGHALRIIPLVGQREHVAWLGKEEVIENALTNVLRRLLQGWGGHAVSGGQEKAQPDRQHGNGQYPRQWNVLMTALHKQNHQRRQTGQRIQQ